jgi:peptide/nickel transport system permease protein
MAGSIPASPTVETAGPRAAFAALGFQHHLIVRLLRQPNGVVGVALVALFVVCGLAGPALAPMDPFAPIGAPLAAPSMAHPMGTDALGRDLLSGVLAGARTSLTVVGGVGALSFVIGLAAGMLAGYRGGLLDDLVMRVTELFQVLPRFFLAIVVIAMFGPGIDRLVLVLGLTSWPVLARVVRAEVMSLRRRAFVRASVAAGASDLRILTRTILPNVLPAATVYLGLLSAQVLLLEASLGFLGLGDPNAISWGYLAGQAQRFLRVAWWMSAFPGMVILTAVLGMNLLGDAATDVLSGRR